MIARPLPELEGYRRPRSGVVVPIARARRAFRLRRLAGWAAGVTTLLAFYAWAVFGGPARLPAVAILMAAAPAALWAAGRGRR
jgi:hypothetical protein